jgi:hypothetical protein
MVAKNKAGLFAGKKKTTRCGNFLNSNPVNTQQAGARLWRGFTCFVIKLLKML